MYRVNQSMFIYEQHGQRRNSRTHKPVLTFLVIASLQLFNSVCQVDMALPWAIEDIRNFK
jgi:hypothetical protein